MASRSIGGKSPPSIIVIAGGDPGTWNIRNRRGFFIRNNRALPIRSLFCHDGTAFLRGSGSNRRHRGGTPMRLVAGAVTLGQRLLISSIACSSNLRVLGIHAGAHVLGRGRTTIHRVVLLRAILLCSRRGLLCRGLSGLLRGGLANSGAVRGLGRDRNRGKCRDYGGEIFFMAIRQNIHVRNPSIESEKTDGVFHNRQPIAGGDP